MVITYLGKICLHPYIYSYIVKNCSARSFMHQERQMIRNQQENRVPPIVPKKKRYVLVGQKPQNALVERSEAEQINEYVQQQKPQAFQRPKRAQSQIPRKKQQQRTVFKHSQPKFELPSKANIILFFIILFLLNHLYIANQQITDIKEVLEVLQLNRDDLDRKQIRQATNNDLKFVSSLKQELSTLKDNIVISDSERKKMDQKHQKTISLLKEQINRLHEKLSLAQKQTETKEVERRRKMEYIDKTIEKMRERLDKFSNLQQKVKDAQNEINMIILSDLERSQKVYHSMKKLSTPFPLQFERDQIFKQNYYRVQYKLATFEKLTNEAKIAHGVKAMQRTNIQHFSIKIIKSQLSMIAIGIFTNNKRDRTCAYCENDNMYYIYGKNGYLYNGNTFLGFIHLSKPSKVKQIRQNSIVTVFVYNQEHQIVWFVNQKYAGSMTLNDEDKTKRLIPFVIMQSRGDIFEVVTY